MKEKRPHKDAPFLLLAAILVFLIATTVYYVLNQDMMIRRTNLVGDGVCGNLLDEEGQDYCCGRAHADDAHATCIGSWEYVSGIEYCQYVCEGSLPSCTEEAKVCPDGGAVARNASLDCEFDDC